jgi:hypothetical protein
MKTIPFEEGQRIQGTSWHLDKTRIGMEGTILKPAEYITGREAFSGRTVNVLAYEVLWDDGNKSYCPVPGVTMALPKRGDMDTKVGWTWLAPEVVSAMTVCPGCPKCNPQNPNY